MLLCTAMESVFVLENPSSSLMFEFHHLQEVIRRLKRVGVKVGRLKGSEFTAIVQEYE